jgi:C1A family cysteine protease
MATVDQDAGAQIRDIIQVLVQTGAGPEKDWPYVEANFAKAPPARELTEAAECKATVYSRLTSRQDYRECLAQGFPFVTGVTLYEEFESDDVAQTGIVPMPGPFSQIVGGHAITIIGYNCDFNGGDYYEVQNSWGSDWGDDGRCWLPAAYLESPNLCMDSWTVRK